jgi:hypothetical protein
MHYQPLTSLVAQMRDGTLSAREVTEHHLARIAALDPKLHAYAEVRADRAREDAAAADARRAKGETLGPLHGAPVSVKDLCAMKGTRTGAGGFFSTGFGPDDTATVVRRLQEAGAIVLGKAQLTEGAWGTHHPDIPAPLGTEPLVRLIIQRFWRIGRRRHGSRNDWHRYSRFDPLSQRGQRHRRPQANVGPRQPPWRFPALGYFRSCRSDGAHGRRCRPHVQLHRRARYQ